MGVVVVLGRAPCDHPLAQEQVFQTLDGILTLTLTLTLTPTLTLTLTLSRSSRP